MRVEFKILWEYPRNCRRIERVALHVEEFSIKPKLTLRRYLKMFGWLGIWFIYEGKFLQFLRRASDEKR